MKELEGFIVKECPFCGKIDTVDFANLQEEEDCENFENEDRCPAFESCTVCNGVYVICSAKLGGCGSHSGFRWRKDLAVKAWNMRGGYRE